MSHHLVILTGRYLERILSGFKTAECRLSQSRRVPFESVSPGDTLWLKRSSGPVVARAIAHGVIYVHPLLPADLEGLRDRFLEALQTESGFFQSHRRARYATLIHLGEVRRIAPQTVRKSDQRAWVRLPGPLA